MRAVVNYTVTDPNGATIGLIFNDKFIEPGIIIEFPNLSSVVVPPGSGQVELFRDVTVPDWGDDANFVSAIALINTANEIKTVVTQTIQQPP